MNFGEKLKALMKAKKINSIELAKMLKLTQLAISHWLNNKKKPNLEKAQELAQIFGVSVDYLLNNSSVMTNSAPFHNIDVFEMVAGFGTEGYLDSDFRVEAQIALPSEFLGSISPKYAKIIRCLGDSMEPEFSDGDYMMIEMLANRNYIKRAGIYLVRLDNIIYIKRAQFLPNNDIKLISINPNYPPFTASSTGYEWEILACVFGRISVKIGSGFQFDPQGIK